MGRIVGIFTWKGCESKFCLIWYEKNFDSGSFCKKSVSFERRSGVSRNAFLYKIHTYSGRDVEFERCYKFLHFWEGYFRDKKKSVNF